MEYRHLRTLVFQIPEPRNTKRHGLYDRMWLGRLWHEAGTVGCGAGGMGHGLVGCGGAELVEAWLGMEGCGKVRCGLV